MAKKGWDGKVPVAKATGEVQSWAPRAGTWAFDKIEFRDNWEFDDTLVFVQFVCGGSRVNMQMKSRTTGMNYSFFLTDTEKMLPAMDHGVIKGRFTFCKRGGNFGTVMVTPPPIPFG